MSSLTTTQATPTHTTLDSNDDGETMERCKEMQKEEFEVLESIYPEYVSSQSLDGTLKLEVPVEFGSPRSVVISEASLHPNSTPGTPHDANLGPISTGQKVSLSLQTLPPIMLHLHLPPTYPEHKPPEVVALRATHVWLPDTSRLQQLLIDLWQPGEPILYNWVEYIRTGEFLDKLGLVSIEDGNAIMLRHDAPQALAPVLTSYAEASQSNQFARNTYPCSICLTWLKGSKCLQLLCKHIFCRSCLEDFWKMCIEEGEVGKVGCPDPECVKKGQEAGEEEVARIVTKAELERWRWLREKRNYDRDPTVIHCPVAVCQTPVPKPSDADNSESGWSKLRQCPKCGFSFCAFCKRTWHGPLDKCPIAQYEELALEYMGSGEGSAARAQLERRFGRANILRLVATYQEEKANLEWLESSAMMCPGCRCYVEKVMGCNHMTCSKCSQHFCYRCGDRLHAGHPYSHFSVAGGRCYNQLFDGVEVREEWEEVDLPIW